MKNKILALIKREVVPAMGCTEPMAVALCVAAARELLGEVPGRVIVGLSANMLKNAMGVGIPGTGMIGLPIAIALGATIGRTEYGLEVIKDVNDKAVALAREYMAKPDRIEVHLVADAPSKLYIDVKAEDGQGHCAQAVISDSHTRFIHKQLDDKVLLDAKAMGDADDADDVKLTLRMVYDFAMDTPLDELRFILESARLNTKASEQAMNKEYGHCLGFTISRYGRELLGDTPLTHMLAATSAACDARMGGCPIAVMSNSGSGNQGITATMPVVSFARDMNATEEQTIRALTLSHLTSIYIKQGLGRLSALCGCVVASTGASSGIAYLMGADYDHICMAIKNMVANLTGMLCDGAKPSCSMKVASGVSTAMLSAMLAMHDRCATNTEGIVCDDVDATISNLTSIGKDAMRTTDEYVLRIMTSK